MSMENKRISMNDLANMTGFSLGTVSKVLNNKGRISDKTRKIIIDKAKEYNFVADYFAQALAKNESLVIGVIFPEYMGVGFSHPFYSVVLDSFRKTIESYGYEMLFLSPKMGKHKMTYVEYCKYRKVDGVLVVTFNHSDEQLIKLVESDIPLVCTDLNDYNTLTVVSDDFKGGQLATNYLLNQGHKSIMHIAGPLTVAAGLNRFLGYESIMLENGVKDFKLRVADNFTFEDGYANVLELIQRKRVPTGLFFSSDWMAIGAIKALSEHGYRVPEDISVIGYDNIDFFKYYNPGLTTIAQNAPLIGEKAATLLKNVIDGKEVESIVLDVKLIERESCRKIEN